MFKYNPKPGNKALGKAPKLTALRAIINTWRKAGGDFPGVRINLPIFPQEHIDNLSRSS